MSETETFTQMLRRHRREILAHLRETEMGLQSITVKVEIQQTIWPGKPGRRIEMIGCADRRDEATP